MAEDTKRQQRTKDASDLLDLAIDAMRDQLQKRPPCDKCGFSGHRSASDVNNAIRFLKDNGFNVDKEQTEDYLDRIKRERQEREAAAKVNPDVQPRTA